jgi:hypothetical protein
MPGPGPSQAEHLSEADFISLETLLYSYANNNDNEFPIQYTQ